MKKRKERGVTVVIGANGVLGQALMQGLNEIGYTTIGTGRKEVANCEYFIQKPDLSATSCDAICKEIDNIADIRKKPIEAIFYVAGFGYADQLLTRQVIAALYQVNCNAAERIALYYKGVRFIYFSSCAVLGTSGTMGLETYAANKREAEAELKRICSCLSIVRPTIIPDTKFMNRAQMAPSTKKGFWDSQKVAEYVIKHSRRKLILPGIQAVILHLLNAISPRLAQTQLKP